MIALQESLARAAARLKAADIESARLEARLLAAHALALSADDVLTARGEIAPADADKFEEMVTRRLAGEPIAYITGIKEFFGVEFGVGPGALVPRPESETLLEEALHDFSGDRASRLDVLDLGTGTGCLLISFLLARPDSRGLGLDRSALALKWSKRNVLRHGLEDRCELEARDWTAGLWDNYDVVFANPPYLESGEIACLPKHIRWEPGLALNGGVDGLRAYRELAPVLAKCLRPTGRAYLEIGQGQHHMVIEILEKAGLRVTRVAGDLAGIPRCVVASLGAGSPLS